MPEEAARAVRVLAGVVGRHTVATALTAVVLRRLQPALDGAWFRVRAGERTLHRRAGVPGYRRLLRATGWDRVVAGWRSFDGTRAGLAALDRHTRLSEATHLGGAVVGTLLVLCRGGSGVGARRAVATAGAAVLGVAIHVHPVLVQRSLRSRIGDARRR